MFLTIVGAVFITWFVVALLFTPHIPYVVEAKVSSKTDHFVRVLEGTCQAHLEDGNRVEILTNGDAFYPAMLDAIRNARETINMECYIFKKGEVGDRFIDALCARARAGVRVTLVMDAVGSFGAFRAASTPLREAGVRVSAYQRFTWYRFHRLNNRTHRELLVVDGDIAFVGGAGVADWWLKPVDGHPPWRDMMARIEGPIVAEIQGVVAENWTECCGEILTGPETFKLRNAVGDVAAFATKSSPSDRSTVSRLLFQLLVEAATGTVRIATPYFLPDRAFRDAIARTCARGVAVTVLVPGAISDQTWVRLASRRLYGDVLRAGARVYEYDAGMTHVKALMVDDLWTVIGTTNIDNRSFEHNDEVNVAIRDEGITARVNADFQDDLGRSREITLEAWKKRPAWEKLVGLIAWILERQQ